MDTIIKQNNKNYRLDLTNRRITFLDTRFYYNAQGKPVPSVTTILEAYPKGAAFYEWLKKNGQDSDEIRDEAGRKGSRVHDLTERYDRGEEISLLTESGDIAMSMVEWNMFEKYVQFSDRFAPVHEQVEMNLVGDLFAGTLDRLSIIAGKSYILDIKTSNAIQPHYWLQMAAYTKLLIELGHTPPDEMGILWLNAKTKTDGKPGTMQGIGWQLITAPEPWQHYYKIFEHVYHLWHVENGGMAPRQISYSLTHSK